MNIRSALGERLFRRPTPTEPSPVTKQISEFHGEYTRFCGLINPTNSWEWRRRGHEDFPRLLSTDGVMHVGIDWNKTSLLILTEHIIVEDSNRTWRDIGEIIVEFSPREKTVAYENVTRVYRSEHATYHHPHVLNGTLCSSANARIMQNFLDAAVSEAMTSVVRCLRMRYGEIVRNMPYHDASNWPTIAMEKNP